MVGIGIALIAPNRDSVSQKLSLYKGGEPLPAEVVASEAQLTGSVRYLLD